MVENVDPTKVLIENGEVRFYMDFDKNGVLCNYYHSPFIIDGKSYPTSEHYF